jgi:DNA polymerase
MTSPAQLKYLQAMGISVWVSRELVLHEEIAAPKLKNEDTAKKVTVTDAVNTILHDLEEQQHTKSHSNKRVVTSGVASTEFKVIANTGLNLLAQTEQHNIYACGSLHAKWLVIGESPEFINDDTNQPYAGDSGVLLDNMLKAVGIQNPRSEAYLVNILNRSQQQIADQKVLEKLHQLLHNKITQIKPKILLVIGQLAAQNILQTKEPLARLRGKPHTFPETVIPVVVTYYPSYLLSKPLDKRKAWEDLKLAMSLIE